MPAAAVVDRAAVAAKGFQFSHFFRHPSKHVAHDLFPAFCKWAGDRWPSAYSSVTKFTNLCDIHVRYQCTCQKCRYAVLTRGDLWVLGLLLSWVHVNCLPWDLVVHTKCLQYMGVCMRHGLECVVYQLNIIRSLLTARNLAETDSGVDGSIMFMWATVFASNKVYSL